MLTNTRSRRTTWLAGLAVSAMTVLTLPAAQAYDVGPPVLKDDSCVNLSEELVFDPGGGAGNGGFEHGVPHAPYRHAGDRSDGLLRADSKTPAPKPTEGAGKPKAADLPTIIALDPSLRFVTKPLGDAEIAPHWGKTVLKKLQVRTVINCINRAARTWHAAISATQPVEQGVRLLPGVSEVDAALVQSTATSTLSQAAKCQTLVKMSDDLKWESSLAGTGVPLIGPLPRPRTQTTYYMKGAVQAHEDVHVDRHKRAIAGPYKRFKQSVENTVIIAEDRAQAWAQVRKTRKQAGERFVAEMAAYFAEADHHTPEEFKNAEATVVWPMISSISRWRTRLGCPQVG